VVSLTVRTEPDRDTRRDDEQALEEIRLLFARYRRIARHGQAIERDEPPARADDDPHAAAVPTP
jgi:hypothetical protein